MLNWLIPKTVETATSKFNGLIKVKKFLGRYAVWVGGYEQSGPMVTNVWKKALQGLPLPGQGEALRNVLVLGLGCGSVVPLVRNKWPKAKITGVEIDPEMIRLGKKYFHLSGVKIFTADANKFLKSTHQKFDLILIDAYLGGHEVKLKILGKIKSKTGMILINKLENDVNEILVQ